MGRPRASWLQQVDRHLKEMGMGQASAWGMFKRRTSRFFLCLHYTTIKLLFTVPHNFPRLLVNKLLLEMLPARFCLFFH